MELDTAHFVDVDMSVNEYEHWLKGEYKSRRWDLIATWAKGEPPVPYCMYKLKDLIRDCTVVFAEKSKCCRQRPISPNTHHWLRRVYRRVGMCLRLMILSLPAGSVTLLSSQKLQPWLASLDQGSDDGYWLKYTGDIANCYDELDHDRCLDGVRWALDSLPGWLGKRRADGFSCSLVDKKDCRLGKSESTDRVNISLAQVYEVCEFDCRNSVILVPYSE